MQPSSSNSHHATPGTEHSPMADNQEQTPSQAYQPSGFQSAIPVSHKTTTRVIRPRKPPISNQADRIQTAPLQMSYRTTTLLKCVQLLRQE